MMWKLQSWIIMKRGEVAGYTEQTGARKLADQRLQGV